ncbi:hypothetical protein WA556_005209, partial [Blastocystis sp. ATCC 50177/Nand II]
MEPIHGKHHKGPITYQRHKQQIQDWQSRLLLHSVPPNEYCITNEGKYRCRICPNSPLFPTGQLLLAHIRGKKHSARLMEKSELITHEEDERVQEKPLPTASMAMPSLLYRTNAIKQRVLESNHAKSAEKVVKRTPPRITSSSEKPEWLKKIEEEKEERAMIAKGFRKNADGMWERDPMVEFDSDEEPT